MIEHNARKNRCSANGVSVCARVSPQASLNDQKTFLSHIYLFIVVVGAAVAAVVDHPLCVCVSDSRAMRTRSLNTRSLYTNAKALTIF